MIKEEWRDIKDYEGLYQVSNLGRVKSLPRLRHNQYNNIEIIMKQKKTPNGYLQVSLSIDGVQTLKNVHRLVAEAFIPNPHNLPQINHKDENKANNIFTNLEWCSSKYNMNYGNRNEKAANALKGRIGYHRQILQYDLNGNLIKEWDGAYEAGDALGLDRSSITKVLMGKNNSCGGFVFRYKEEA